MIEFQDLEVRLGGRAVLDGANGSLPTGVTALLGRNGAGKTTLIRSLSGLVRLHAGTVRVDGVDPFVSHSALTAYRRSLGFMPQDPPFVGSARVLDVVRYAAWLRGLTKSTEHASAMTALSDVDLGDHLRARVRTLSGGQRRRVALACALVGEPRFLLLDEPTAGLDPDQRDHFLDRVRGLAPDRTVLVSTHLMEDVLAVADHIAVLDGGRIVRSVPVAEVLAGTGEGPATAMRELRRSLLGDVSA
ncbi:ABC transporter ATP-binding protein [Antribacter gilvus]|uniref:ABC transporter ATP-binding protein n=1 Tax=Antribacter gilvus TaxID=2304675 RepID=UPI0013E0602E|nr:ATP-binding cassette domain-containing protein [Antribacter gilvus]